MTKDIQFIIDHKRSKYEIGEYFDLIWTLLCSTPFMIVGYGFAINSPSFDSKVFGLVLGVCMTWLTIHVIRQFKSLNQFESIKTTSDSQTNFTAIIEVMRILDPDDVDNDFRNRRLAIKLTKHRIHNWLTFIALDNEILLNERPNILAFWWSWNFKERAIDLLKNR